MNVLILALLFAAPDAEETQWRQTLQSQPNVFEANFNLGLLHFRRKQPEAAEPLLARAAAANPKHFESAYLLGAVRSQQGKTDDALRAWRKALALQPANQKLMRIMAIEYRKGGYLRDAAATAERALDPADERSWQDAIRAWHDAGDEAQALRLAQRFRKALPGSNAASFELGYALFRAGDLARAEPLLAAAVQSANANEEAFHFYGEMLAAKSDSRAPDMFREALKRRPEYTAARLALARALTRAGKPAEAKHELSEAIRRDAAHPQAHAMLAQILFREGDEDGAARHRRVAEELRRTNPGATEGQQSRPFVH